MDIAIIIILIAFSAFFSATETAYSSVNRIRLKSMAENGSNGAKTALNVLKKYDKALTTILIGNNIVNIATSSIATLICVALVGEAYGSVVATVAVTIIVLTFGEVLPKSIAKDHAETLCVAIGGVLSFFMFIFTPFSALFILLKKGISRIFTKKQSVSVTEEELIAIIDEIEDEGVLEEQESNLVRSALEFDEITVDEIITPRVSITGVEVYESAENVSEIFLKEEYSRMPVYEKTLDNIIGIINEKEFFKHYMEDKNFPIRSIIQEATYVPHLLKIPEVLKIMQKTKAHMCVVLDQHGGTLGIVTLEDVLEELVGEIWDENDEVKPPVSFISENIYEAYGDVSINSFRRYFENRELNIVVKSEAKTIAGWVFELFGRIPEVGDKAETDKFRVTVLEIADLRVNKIRFEILAPEVETEEEE